MNDVKAFELHCMWAAVLKPPENGSLFQFRNEKETKVGLDWEKSQTRAIWMSLLASARHQMPFSTAFSWCSSKGYLLTSINTFRRNVCFSKEKQVLILKKVFNSCTVSKTRRNPISWRKIEKYTAACRFHAIGTFHFNLKFLTSNTKYLLSPINGKCPISTRLLRLRTLR